MPASDPTAPAGPRIGGPRGITHGDTPHTTAHPRHVLIIEDGPDARRALGRLLEIWGHHVELAAAERALGVEHDEGPVALRRLDPGGDHGQTAERPGAEALAPAGGPVHGLERREAHGGDFAKVDRRREAREHLRAQRGHDILVGRRRREHDHLHARTDDPELGGERQVLGD